MNDLRNTAAASESPSVIAQSRGYGSSDLVFKSLVGGATGVALHYLNGESLDTSGMLMAGAGAAAATVGGLLVGGMVQGMPSISKWSYWAEVAAGAGLSYLETGIDSLNPGRATGNTMALIGAADQFTACVATRGLQPTLEDVWRPFR